MKLNLSTSPLFAVLVIVGLAAGTALLAGYVDKPNQAAQANAEGRCDGCPRLNTDACCKVTGVCANPETCTSPCIQRTSEGEPAGCCPKTTQAAWPTMSDPAQATCPMAAGKAQTACPMMSGQAESSCGAGGCTQAE
jgi:hypothetical protein